MGFIVLSQYFANTGLTKYLEYLRSIDEAFNLLQAKSRFLTCGWNKVWTHNSKELRDKTFVL